MKYMLCISILITISHSIKIPASLTNNKYDLNNYYTLDIDIGFPRKSYKLAIDFTSNVIELYQPINMISSSYSSNDVGSDYIYIEKLRYRVPVVINYQKKASYDGTFGIGRSSFIWNYYSDISISASGILLGEIHELIKNNDGCNMYVSNCIDSDNQLCKTKITLNRNTYNLLFSSNSKHALPSRDFYNYMSGKSIYKDYSSYWEPINLQLNTKNVFNNDVINFFKSHNMDIQNCRSNINVTIHSETILPSTIKNSYNLMMQPHDGNEVMLGVETWKNYVTYYNRRHEIIIIKSHVVQDHFSFWNIFAFCFLLTLFVRFKLIGNGKLVTTTHESIEGKSVLFINMLVSMPITMSLYCLNVTRSVLDNYISFTIIIGIVLIIFITLLIYSMLVVFWQYDKVSFFWGSINSVCYDNILLYGMWLALVERRTDGLESFFILVINIIIIYCIVYHLLVVIGYIYLVYPLKETKYRIKPYFWLYSLGFLPILFGYQLYITYILFALPMIMLYQPELGPGSAFLLLLSFFLIVVVFALYISAMSVGKAMNDILNVKKK